MIVYFSSYFTLFYFIHISHQSPRTIPVCVTTGGNKWLLILMSFPGSRFRFLSRFSPLLQLILRVRPWLRPQSGRVLQRVVRLRKV